MNPYCRDCNVYLYDDETLRNHEMGKPHLKQIQRIREDYARRAMENYSDTTRTGIYYYEQPSQFVERIADYHSRSRRESVERRRSRSPIQRTDRENPNEGENNNCIRGQMKEDYMEQNSKRTGRSSSAYPVIPTGPTDEYRPKMEPEIKRVWPSGQYYCPTCDTYCARMDVMQAHLSGKNHKKKTKQIARYACDLCLIEVSSAETLQTHYQGMSHIKRAKVAEEAKKEQENDVNSSLTEFEELADLRQRCLKLERQNANLQKEVDQLLKFKKNCIKHHHKLKTEAEQPEDADNDVFLE